MEDDYAMLQAIGLYPLFFYENVPSIKKEAWFEYKNGTYASFVIAVCGFDRTEYVTLIEDEVDDE